MTEHNDYHRKRDLLKRGYDKVTSKFNHSSHEDQGPSNLVPAMSTTFSSTLSMIPQVSQALKQQYYPLPNPSQAVQDADETHYRGPTDPRTCGNQTLVQFNRLPGTSGKKDSGKPAEKKEDSKKKDDSKKNEKKGKN